MTGFDLYSQPLLIFGNPVVMRCATTGGPASAMNTLAAACVSHPTPGATARTLWVSSLTVSGQFVILQQLTGCEFPPVF